MAGCAATLEKMPLSEFQKEVMAVISKNRSEQSHIAGGIVLNVSDDSARFSHDFDIFHEAAEAVQVASERDCSSLEEAGFAFEPSVDLVERTPDELESQFKRFYIPEFTIADAGANEVIRQLE